MVGILSENLIKKKVCISRPGENNFKSRRLFELRLCSPMDEDGRKANRTGSVLVRRGRRRGTRRREGNGDFP